MQGLVPGLKGLQEAWRANLLKTVSAGAQANRGRVLEPEQAAEKANPVKPGAWLALKEAWAQVQAALPALPGALKAPGQTVLSLRAPYGQVPCLRHH